MISLWQNIYNYFDPIAFTFFGKPIHWYGIMYLLAIALSLLIAHWIIKKDNIPISHTMYNDYFLYAEVGVILGARIGDFIFYSDKTLYYLSHPWLMFNPYDIDGNFIGISGMSYHGAIIGCILATIFFIRIHKVSFMILVDIVAISLPLAYTFGRIGNFLNKELFGRETDFSIGIYIDGVLRYPSQLYEAFLEGIVLFLILFTYRKYKKFHGELMAIYLFFYSIFRFTIEFVREPETSLNLFCCSWITMGQILSILMFLSAFLFYYIACNLDKKNNL